MANIAVEQCSWLGPYYDINKFENLSTESPEVVNVAEDENFYETRCKLDLSKERTEGLKLLRNPTFFPTSTVSHCGNCEVVDSNNTMVNDDSPDDDKQKARNKPSYSKSAIAFCRDCRLPMCRACCECHGSMKVFKEHVVVPMLSSNENFIKKSVKTKQKRHKIEKYLKICKSAADFHLVNKGKVAVDIRKEIKNAMSTSELEAYAVECHESVIIHKEIDEKVSGLTQRIEHLKTELNLCDQVVERFCQTMLSTQVSVTEIGEHIRKKIELQVDEMLEKMKKEAIKFCSNLEDKKEKFVNSIDELTQTRNDLFFYKSKRKFDKSDRDKLTILLEKIPNIQSKVMSSNREVRERMEISFTPLDLSTCCPSIGRLELSHYLSERNSSYVKSAHFAQSIPFKNEIRGITKFRNELAVVTANCSTLFFFDLDSLEMISTFKVKDMKNPYDVVADRSNVLFVTEWSDKFIHKIELPIKQVTKISTKNYYTTLSVTPSGFALATCPFKNKARELDGKKTKYNTIHLIREKESLLSPGRTGSSGSSSDEISTNVQSRSANIGGNGILGNASHVLAISDKENGEFQYIFCTSDNHLIQTDKKGSQISSYKKTFKNVDSKLSQRNISLALHKPSHLAFDSEGFVFVCDSGNDRIILLDKFLNFVKEIIQPGIAGIRSPIRIFLDLERSRLFVAATSLYVFDLF